MFIGWDILLKGIAFSSVIGVFLIMNLFRNRRTIDKILLLFFAICLLLISTNFRWNYYPLADDAKMYHSVSSDVAANLRSGKWDVADIFIRNPAYTIPLGVLYAVFGDSEIVGRLFSTVFGIGVLYNVYALALILFNRRTAVIAASILSIFPFFWLLSCVILRDMMIAFLVTLFFLILARIQFGYQKISKRSIHLEALVIAVYLGWLRPPLLLLLIMALIIYFLISTRSIGRWKLLYRFIIFVMIIVVLSIGYVGVSMVKEVSDDRLTQGVGYMDTDYMDKRIYNTRHAGSYYMQDVRYSNYKDIITTMPLATIYFLFSPLPWQINSIKQSLGLLDSFEIFLIVWFFLKGIRDSYRNRQKFTMPLLIFLFIGCAFSGVMQGNSGAAMRHRTMFIYLMFPIAAHGMLLSRRKTKQAKPSLFISKTYRGKISETFPVGE